MTRHSWYAVAVKRHREKSVACTLRESGIAAFVPCSSPGEPLFSGYVFSAFDGALRPAVLSTPGVTAIAGSDGPAPLPADQILFIRAIAASGLPAKPYPYSGRGQVVRIERGALAGLQGELIRNSDSLLVVVSIELIRRAVAVEIAREQVCALQGAVYAPMAHLYLSP